jgi:hypothetical protein
MKKIILPAVDASGQLAYDFNKYNNGINVTMITKATMVFMVI